MSNLDVTTFRSSSNSDIRFYTETHNCPELKPSQINNNYVYLSLLDTEKFGINLRLLYRHRGIQFEKFTIADLSPRPR